MSTFCLSVIQLSVKLSGSTLTLAQQLFSRNFCTLLLAVYYVKRENVCFLGKKKSNFCIMSLRAVFGLLGMWIYFYASQKLLIADATIANKTSPLFVAVFGVLFLKQKLSAKQIGCLLLGFMGVAVMTRPQFQSDAGVFGLAMLGAVFSALGHTMISVLNGREKKSTIIFVNALVSLIILLPFTDFSFLQMDLTQWFHMAVIGVMSAVGQVFLTYAYNNNFSGEVSLYNYFGIVFSAIWGYVFFHEMISVYSFIGIVILILSAVGMYRAGQKAKAAQ